MLSAEQIADYDRDGFVIVRGAVSDAEIERLYAGLARNPPLDGTLQTGLTYPEPGRYTLATQAPADPDLGFIIEHPGIVQGARELLRDEPRLTAFVLYDRTPGGSGLPAHNDYKRWRPVGSSMNWLFTIVPMCDYDADTGRLFVAPGSHRLERVHPGPERPLEVEPAIRPEANAFVDPGLRRGDLLLMNMHLWHRAEPNRSNSHRVGIFNKYAAAGAPPATGYYLYNEDVVSALSPDNRGLIAAHSDRSIVTVRAVLLQNEDTPKVFVADTGAGPRLPGGPAWHERAIPDWDLGNMIAPLEAHLRDSLDIETPWMSWIGDYPEGDGLCRVYGYTLTGHGFPVPYRGGRWLDREQLGNCAGAVGYELEALDAWLDPAPVRGKGISQARARIDQYAY